MKNYAKKAAICHKVVERFVGKVELVDVIFYDPLFEGEPRDEAFVFQNAAGRRFEMDLNAAKAGYCPAIDGVRGYSVYPPEPWELEQW